MVMRRLVTNFKAGTNDNDGGEPGDDQEGDDDIVQNNVEKICIGLSLVGSSMVAPSSGEGSCVVALSSDGVCAKTLS